MEQNNVFINCPYDKKYKRLFILIVFSCFYFGYEPYFTSEIPGAESRIDKIIKLIKKCSYGIHDISVVYLSKKERLPRFNMSFELGLDFMLKHNKQNRSKLLILQDEQYRHHKTISDLCGCDIAAHNWDGNKLLSAVISFFTGIKKYELIPTSTNIHDIYLKTFTLWMYSRTGNKDVKQNEDLEMGEIKQNMKTFFETFQQYKAQTAK